jgi:hypothetical protein
MSMPSYMTGKPPSPEEELKRFYRDRDIEDDDLDGKMHAMKANVRIPNFPYDRRQPALYEYEQEFLREKGHQV